MGQVVEDVGWRGVRIDRPRSAGSNGKPAAYPVARGTLIGLGPKEALLWTRASATGTEGQRFESSRAHDPQAHRPSGARRDGSNGQSRHRDGVWREQCDRRHRRGPCALSVRGRRRSRRLDPHSRSSQTSGGRWTIVERAVGHHPWAQEPRAAAVLAVADGVAPVQGLATFT